MICSGWLPRNVIAGMATVRAINGDLVDITALGADPEYALGEITVELYSNSVEVKPA